MSIIQSVIGSVQGGSSPPYYYLGTSGSYGEGNTLTLYLNYERANGSAVYWSIEGTSATQGSDYTTHSGNYSGILTPVGTNNGYIIDYIDLIADHLTEGTEYFNLRLGTYPGGNDLTYTTENINDTSQAPKADFTIEWWQKMSPTQSGPYPRFFNVGTYPAENPGISFEPSWIFIWGGGSAGSDRVPAVYNETGIWVHWAIERHNNTMAFYKNGTNILSSNNLGPMTINNSGSPLTIGYGSSNYWNGKMADFHWVKGHAKYQGNFSLPTSPIGVTTGSKLLLNVVTDGDKLLDSTGNHTFSTTNTVSFDSDSPYSGSTGSLVFNNSYIASNASSDWALDG